MATEKTLAELMWDQINNEIKAIKKRIDTLESRTERCETTSGAPSVTLANAPLAATGARGGDILFISNGRKTGEGAGLGTGLLAYYNPNTNSWYRPADDTAVVV